MSCSRAHWTFSWRGLRWTALLCAVVSGLGCDRLVRNPCPRDLVPKPDEGRCVAAAPDDTDKGTEDDAGAEAKDDPEAGVAPDAAGEEAQQTDTDEDGGVDAGQLADADSDAAARDSSLQEADDGAASVGADGLTSPAKPKATWEACQ